MAGPFSNRTLWALVGAGLLVGVVSSNSAIAQEAHSDTKNTNAENGDTQNMQLEEITVTARRRTENMQDVPISINAFSSTDLAERAVQDLSEIGPATPNMTFNAGASRAGGMDTGTIFIRGVGQTDYQSFFDPGVGIYVDDIYLGRSAGAVLEALDLQSVDVLRGPQGTLFGRNTIGGAIAITSTMPSQTLGGYLQAEYGSYDERNVKGAIDLPLSSTLAVRISVSDRNRDGTVDSLSMRGLSFGNIDNSALRVVAKWQPSDGFVATIIADGSLDRSVGQAWHTVAVNSDAPLIGLFNATVAPNVHYPAYGSSVLYPPIGDNYITGKSSTWEGLLPFGAPENNLNNYGASLNLEWQLSDSLTFKSISAFRKLDFNTIGDYSGTPFYFDTGADTQHQKQFSQEFRITGVALTNTLHYTAGLYDFQEWVDEFVGARILDGVYQQTGNAGLDFSYEIPSQQRSSSDAAYADATWDIWRGLSISLGGRYTYEHRDAAVMTSLQDSDTTVIPNTRVMRDYSAFTPRFGAQYKFADDVMGYVSMSKGFKSGGIDTAAPTTVADVKPFLPEYQTTYEAGVKSEWFGHRLRINADVFRGDYTNIQEVASLAQGQLGCTAAVCDIVVNAVRARIEGAEAEINVEPLPGLQIIASPGYVNQKFTFIDPILIGAGVLNYNTKLPMTPKWSSTVAAQLDKPIASNLHLSERVDYSYRTTTFESIENDPYTTQHPYGLLSARIALSSSGGEWEIALSGKNLTNKAYIEAANPLYSSFGFSAVAYGDPRTFTVSLRHKF